MRVLIWRYVLCGGRPASMRIGRRWITPLQVWRIAPVHSLNVSRYGADAGASHFNVP